LTFRFFRPVLFQEYPAYTLRGLLGYALIRLLHPELAAGEDPPADSPFWRIFKPRLERRDKGAAPHLFLLDCAAGPGFGTALRARLRTFGRAVELTPLLIEAFKNHGAVGFGESPPTPYELDAAPVHVPPPPWTDRWRPAGSRAWLLEFTTPAQLSVGVQTLEGSKRRIQLHKPRRDEAPLFFLGRPVDEFPGRMIDAQLALHATAWAAARNLREMCAASGVQYEQNADAVTAAIWDETEITRVSLGIVSDTPSPKRSIALDGIVGRIEFDAPPELERLLRIGELTGVGARKFEGCGRIKLSTAK